MESPETSRDPVAPSRPGSGRTGPSGRGIGLQPSEVARPRRFHQPGRDG